MCKKLFAVLLVLGLVSNALAVGPEDIELYYTMDAADSMGGYMLNTAPGGSIGDDGYGKENFLSDDGMDYTDSPGGPGGGLIGGALLIDNDGTGLDPLDPNSWGMKTPEAGDFIDISEEVETMLHPFEDVTVSMWIKQTVPLNIDNHVSLWQSQTHATAMPFGTHWTYYGMIKVVQDVDNPGVDPDYLSFKLGGNIADEGFFDTGPGDNIPGKRFQNKEIPLELDEWYHVAYSLGAEQPNGMVSAACYVNGALVHASMVNSFTTKQPTKTSMPGLVVGGYHEISIPGYITQIPDGMLIDDFAILGTWINGANARFIYEQGLIGEDITTIPEPATIALLGLGGLALLRKKR